MEQIIEINIEDSFIQELKKKYIKDLELERTVEQILKFALQDKKIVVDKVSLSIQGATKEEIQEINTTYRGVNRPTDVLSFPIFSREEIQSLANQKEKLKEMELGDIIICLDVVYEHSIEYETGMTREVLYMITHGICHVLGMDHEIEEEKIQMRDLEEKILENIGVSKIHE